MRRFNMCEIRITRVSIGHSWNAHGISGFEEEAPGVGEGDDEDGILVLQAEVDLVGGHSVPEEG
jgi:hypothetical protein